MRYIVAALTLPKLNPVTWIIAGVAVVFWVVVTLVSKHKERQAAREDDEE